MMRVGKLMFIGGIASVALYTAATAQNLEIKRYNPSEWTKGRFTEIITVNGPGKTIYLAGVGAEEENAPAGASAPIRHLGDPFEQCRYAYDKIKRALAAHGGTLADVVKQVVYVTDIRYQAPVGKCRSEAYGNGPIPVNTLLVINGLAIQGMLLEIDVRSGRRGLVLNAKLLLSLANGATAFSERLRSWPNIGSWQQRLWIVLSVGWPQVSSS